MSRKIIPFVVAFILICLVMAVAGVFAFSGSVAAEKFGSQVAWSKSYSTAERLKVIDLTGDKQDEHLIQNQKNIYVFNGDGSLLWSFDYALSKTTLVEFNGDGT